MFNRWFDDGRRRMPATAAPKRINSSHCWYKQCALIGGFCDEVNCPGCVNVGGDYECSVDAMSDFDALHGEINALRQELAYIKHRTMRGGW